MRTRERLAKNKRIGSCLILRNHLAALLGERARQDPEREVFIFLRDGEGPEDRLTYGELDRQARAIAAALQAACAVGDRAILLLPPGLEFVAAFFGCLYAGIVAVPAYPPRSRRMLPRLRSILADCRPALALTTSAALPRLAGWMDEEPVSDRLRWLAVDTVDAADIAAAGAFAEGGEDGDALAFLQYTSGSTAAPKGVMVSHANLIHNQKLIKDACGHDADSVFVTWLPLYHDLGLIGNVLQAVYVGASCALMSPVSFLQRPRSWLEAVSRFRATTSGGPNFAYDLCARKVGEGDLAGLDLGSWRVAFNGAEPVRPETLERFAAAFAPCGFAAGSFYPCYGLAEATLMVSGGDAGGPPVTGVFRAAALAVGRAEPAGPTEEGVRALASSGRPLGGQEVLVVDPETVEPKNDGEIGEIWLAGPSVARGYWGNPAASAATFGARLADGRGPFLRTGDLGFLDDGNLFVTGRHKDLIIIRGRNY
ncbi:MAG TPA: fatty acyl-AMP ligase, partial [Thermoanaerobaculia bacterium]|nr:fatty acyl-AMP ligase [Thermoanaerobaculia bacterium]